MSRPGKTAVAAGILLAGLCGLSFAHSGATGVVKQRMDAMSSISRNMKAIGAMMKGETAFDADVAKTSAEAIAAHAGKIPHQFPEGSNKMPSEALPAIWEDWETFTKIAANLEDSALALANAAGEAQDSSDLQSAFGALVQTCRSCHSDFRKPK